MATSVPDKLAPGGDFPVADASSLGNDSDVPGSDVAEALDELKNGTLILGNGNPPADEGNVGAVWINVSDDDLPLYERVASDDGNVWVLRGNLTGIDQDKLFDLLPFDLGAGAGSAVFGKGKAEGKNAVLFGDGNAFGAYAVSMGRECQAVDNYTFARGKRTQARAPYADSSGVETRATRFGERTHGVAPDDNNLIHQHSQIAQGGITRDATPTPIPYYSGGDTKFTVAEGQFYNVSVTVNALNNSGQFGSWKIDFPVWRPHGGDAQMGGVQKTVIRQDVSVWNVDPVVNLNSDTDDPQRVDFVATGRDGEQVVWDVYIQWHETTIPGAIPNVPVLLSSQAGDRQTTHTFDPLAEQPLFEGHAKKIVVFRGVAPESLRHITEIDPDTTEWTDTGGSRVEHDRPENGTTYYYAFAGRNLHHLESARTDVAEVTPSA